MTDLTFEMSYQVPIHDINFGGHLGHVEWLHILHEARVRFLHQYGQSETNFYGIVRPPLITPRGALTTH